MRRPRARRCGCGAPATHRVVVRMVWSDWARDRTRSEHCQRCANRIVRLWDFHPPLTMIRSKNVRAYRFRTVTS